MQQKPGVQNRLIGTNLGRKVEKPYQSEEKTKTQDVNKKLKYKEIPS